MLTVYTIESAPQAAKETLQGVERAYGFVPNLMGVMAGAPPLAKGYATLAKLFSETSLSSHEQALVLLTASLENGCKYCVAAHSMSALKAGTSPEVVKALVEGRPLPDAKLEALARFTASLVDNRGYPETEANQSFLGAGYTEANILEVILGVGLKTLSNYTNHVAETPIDDEFKGVAR